MNRKTISLLVLTLMATVAVAQTDVDLDTETGLRLSAGVDRKLARGLHAVGDFEARLGDNLSSLDRLQVTAGLRYKLDDHLRFGVGYALIAPYSTTNSAFKSVRHRLMADATASVRLGDFRLSLKERLQFTFRSGDFNTYQTPQPLVGLKSRLMVQYKGLRRWEPYAYAELRHTLNGPSVTANYDGTYYLTASGSRTGDAGWFLDGFNQAYLNRVRLGLGGECRLSRRSALDLTLVADRVSDKVVDANAEGIRLKSYTRETGLALHLAVAYTYSL